MLPNRITKIFLAVPPFLLHLNRRIHKRSFTGLPLNRRHGTRACPALPSCSPEKRNHPGPWALHICPRPWLSKNWNTCRHSLSGRSKSSSRLVSPEVSVSVCRKKEPGRRPAAAGRFPPREDHGRRRSPPHLRCAGPGLFPRYARPKPDCPGARHHAHLRTRLQYRRLSAPHRGL